MALEDHCSSYAALCRQIFGVIQKAAVCCVSLLVLPSKGRCYSNTTPFRVHMETLVVMSQWVTFAKSATHCGVTFKCRWKVRGMSLSPHCGWAKVRPFCPAINHFLPSQQNRTRQRALFFLVFLSLGSWDCPSSGWLTKVICWMFSFYLFVCRTGGEGKLKQQIS